MTNLQRLISILGFSPSENTAEGALLDLGINDGDTYSSSNSTEIKKAAIEVLKVLLSTADSSNNTVGFDIKYDREAILKRIADLEDEVGITEVTTPVIKGIQPW